MPRAPRSRYAIIAEYKRADGMWQYPSLHELFDGTPAQAAARLAQIKELYGPQGTGPSALAIGLFVRVKKTLLKGNTQ